MPLHLPRSFLGISLMAALLATSCRSGTVTHEGLTFRQVSQGASKVWVAEVKVGHESRPMAFYHLPAEVVGVKVMPQAADLLSSPPPTLQAAWISVEPGSVYLDMARAGAARLFADGAGLVALPAGHGTSATDGSVRAPHKTCESKEDGELVLIFQQGNTNEVTASGSCIRLRYHTPQDAIKLTDALAYAVLGVM